MTLSSQSENVHIESVRMVTLLAIPTEVASSVKLYFHRHVDYDYIKVKVKVNQSLYRPEQALRVPGGRGSQISRQLAHEGGKVVSPTPADFTPSPPQEIFLVLMSVSG